MRWGRLAPPLGRLACCFPVYKSHSFLAALGLQHNTRQPPEFKIPEAKFVVEFPLVEVVLKKESVGKIECESSAKILRENWRGVVEI